MHDVNRVLVFRRWLGRHEFIVFASLNNTPFVDGYRISHDALRYGVFMEVFNSDSTVYGGGGVMNTGRRISTSGTLNVRLPANGVIVFQHVATGFVSGFLKFIVLGLAGWARQIFEKCERDKRLMYDVMIAIMAAVLRRLRRRANGRGRQ